MGKFKIVKLKPYNEENLKININEETEEVNIVFDISKSCPGCILQILVSKSKDKYERIADVDACCGRVTLKFSMKDLDEAYIATDAQYFLRDAINNYPNNLKAKIVRVKEKAAIPNLLPIALAAGVVVGILIFKEKIKSILSSIKIPFLKKIKKEK